MGGQTKQKSTNFLGNLYFQSFDPNDTWQQQGAIVWDFVYILNFRSSPYEPDDPDLGGQTFVLMAFVTSAADDVTAGSDGVEHLWVMNMA